MAEEEEDWQEYKLGGYHPVSIGDSFDGRYVVVRKLGWGHFSTVWLAHDERMQRHVALKVVKSAPRYTETAIDEIKLLQRLVTSSDPSTPNFHPGKSHVIAFLDHFRHKGPNGTHVCMVFEVLGESLLNLIKRHQNKGVPIPLVKQIAKQVLQGLDYMHRLCGVIHTDLKPENVLIYIPDVESVIQAELALQSLSTPAPHQIPPPTQRLTGVPTGGRGGNQTPGARHHNINIQGSQPLSPSPSGSVVSLSSLSSGSGGRSKLPADKWGLGMLKISADSSAAEGKGKEREADDLDTSLSALSLSKSAPASTTAPMAVPPPLTLDSDRPDSRSEKVEGEEGWVEEVTDAELDYEIITVKIADLGNATWTNHHFTNDIQTRQYRCPEVIVGCTTWGTSADIWSVACLLFELMSGGDYLFDPAPAPKGAGGKPRYTKDDDHMAQIIELLGDLPAHVLKAGRWSGEFFDSEGKLRHIQNLRPWPLQSVLHDKYLFPQPDADAIADFLLPMLDLNPEGRRDAGELVLHDWLSDVPDIERTFDSGHEADAMKPVDDSAGEIPDQPPDANALSVHHTALVFEGDDAPTTPRP
ncbi:kinase-like domain-containing protein [Mycena alexandri]|uniref:non-specific serine/threonine protein kinase n=1 Tax=Mycena alexandri TaxID=1745969 RepID=A0AAD6T8B5_9AGAR|nr:kinase-like domain-containing protein [Mycena alexandri]